MAALNVPRGCRRPAAQAGLSGSWVPCREGDPPTARGLRPPRPPAGFPTSTLLRSRNTSALQPRGSGGVRDGAGSFLAGNCPPRALGWRKGRQTARLLAGAQRGQDQARHGQGTAGAVGRSPCSAPQSWGSAFGDAALPVERQRAVGRHDLSWSRGERLHHPELHIHRSGLGLCSSHLDFKAVCS